jgi:hypothetical protein
MIFTALMVAGTALSAYQSIQAGKAKQQEFENQAALSLIKTRTKVVNSRLGTILAYKAVGGADPTSGSALTHAIYSYRQGSEDFNVAAIQAELDDKLGLIEYKNLKIAGENAARAGYSKAFNTILMAGANYASQGGFDNVFSKHTGNTKFVASDYGRAGPDPRVIE